MKKLKSLSDLKAINDENVSEYSFANVANVIEASEEAAAKSTADLIAEKVREYDAQVQAKEAEAEKFKNDAKAAQEKTESLEKEVAELKQSLAELQEESRKTKAAQEYNQRMSYFDSEYDLEDDDRSILAKKLQDLDETSFENFKAEFAVFAKAKKKCAKKQDKSGDEKSGMEDEMEDKKSCASTQDKTAEALNDVKEQKEDKPLNTVKADENGTDKYKDAFSLEKGFTLNFTKR